MSRLRRSFEQRELEENHIWYIDPAGKYLGWAITDVQALITAKALPWFDRFSDSEYALKLVLDMKEEQEDFWGFGRKESPMRHYLTGYLALRASQMKLANHHLAAALSSHCFKTVEDRMSVDIRRTVEAIQVNNGK